MLHLSIVGFSEYPCTSSAERIGSDLIPIHPSIYIDPASINILIHTIWQFIIC